MSVDTSVVNMFFCDKCRRNVKYSDKTEESAINLHLSQW